MVRSDELSFQATYMSGNSTIGPGGKDCADMITFREERGANTEPTGLGMERWCVYCTRL